MIIRTAHFALPLCLLVAILFNTGCQNRGKRVNSSTENIAEQSNQSQNLGDIVATKIEAVPEDTDDTVSHNSPSNNSDRELLKNNKYIRLDTIKLDMVSDEYYWTDTLHYLIPKVVATAPEYNVVADSINKQIMKRLEYDPNSATPIEVLWYISIDFEYGFQSHYLLLSYTIVRHSAKGSYEDSDSQLFNLETGECIEQHNIPFSALFSINGYFDFLNSRNWSEGVQKAFEEAYNDMNENEEDPMDEKSLQKEIGKKYKYAKFHIDYSYDKNEFGFEREYNYYAVMPTVARCYEPFYSDNLPIKDLEPYLSDVGKQLLNENYFTLNTIDQILFKIKLWNQIEDYMFFELNDADNSCIAINYQDRKNVWGYLYGKDKVGIDVKGVYEDGILTLRAANDSVYTINIIAYKNQPWICEQIVGYSDKNEPY
ncbi:MAG: hypothetical protein IKW77_00965 [Salinivirgaceae bacterium]|nr:hypothetical protein [Salinivirgaceae bacterium]